MTNAMQAPSIDPVNAALFGGIAEDWWNPQGSSGLLHRINPVRLSYLRERAVAHFGTDPRSRRPLEALRALDVGCGGGLLCEPLARMGAAVTGLDAAPENIAVARAHAAAMGLAIDYRDDAVETLAGSFDLVTCLEVVEHVADLPGFLGHLRRLVAPGGLLVFSTPNRTWLSRLVMITAAEDVLKAIPKGAHDWDKFLRPEELKRALADAGFDVTDLTGLAYAPSRGFTLSRNMQVNYLGSAVPVA
jgi:2-polyprenyl-6-hydroxyphenyl methylase/3-demethylubiquinone-9 3-methyltransferase